jgi:cell division protein FtsA
MHEMRRVIASAEQMADMTVERIYVCFSIAARSERITASVRLNGDAAHEGHIGQVFSAVRRDALSRSEAALHITPTAYAVDGEPVPHPEGVWGCRLDVTVNAMFGELGPLMALRACMERNHIALEGFCASGFASALCVATAGEQADGAAVLDIGAAATQLAVIRHGRLIHGSSISAGGSDITAALAAAFALTPAEAERLKTLHGDAACGPEDEGETIQLPIRIHGGQTVLSVQKPEVSDVIQKRQRSIFTALAPRLEACGLPSWAPLVLTGGGSQLLGVAAFAERVFGRPTRLGAPAPFFAGPSPETGPAFAAAAGLLANVHRGDWRLELSLTNASRVGGGYIARVGGWLRQSF